MKYPTRFFALCILLLAAFRDLPAADQPLDPPESSVWSIVPSNPTTRDFIRVRNIYTGCGDKGVLEASVDVAARKITVAWWGSDICDVVHDDVTDAHIGYLPPGDYVVEFVACYGEFDPGQQCFPSSVPALSFGVTDAGRPRQVIPAWSFAGAFATVFLLAGVALFRFKPRQG
jgi:hypothetical protein